MTSTSTNSTDPLAKPAILIGESRPDLLQDEVLAEIFASTVKARGDHVALTDGLRSLTYAQVWAQACKIARGLARSGVLAGDMVGLWMPRGIDLLVAQI
ncbi:MAG: AMP-binding protein, partial [Bosea sp. (in: a-proteobacteria)]